MLFQSLLHQGISLLNSNFCVRFLFCQCFNPFFIRASVYCLPFPEGSHYAWQAQVSIPSSSGHQFTDGQSFNAFHAFCNVSIPSSSGHQFTGRTLFPPNSRTIPSFQSLLHQGISLLRRRAVSAHCGAAPVSIPSSSGHQFTGERDGTQAPQRGGVSIPSSSGHQFTGPRLPIDDFKNLSVFQSLLHQGISLLTASDLSQAVRLILFQSLLHQGISLLWVEGER